MPDSLRLGVIGAGNMGNAIVDGVLSKGAAVPDCVWVYDKIKEKADGFAVSRHVHSCASPAEVFAHARVILLALKPQDLNSFAEEAKNHVQAGQVIISILAGKTLAGLKKVLGPKAQVVRVMPNLGAGAGESMSVLSGENEQALRAAELVFNACGKTLILEEKFFDLVTAVSGSGPAYFFLLMELLTGYGIQNGLSAEQAKTLAVQTAFGASLLASRSESMPGELRGKVTSKGGTTQAALDILESKKIREIFQQALDAAAKRSKELSS